MATDAWLLEQLIAGQIPPTMRLYRWQPAALSLGYHQKQWPAQWRSLTWQRQSVDLVRRPTGGRAVIHQGDLTYAVVMPLRGRRQDLYRLICNGLIAAWQRLGVSLSFGTAGRNYRHQANCFALATAADLVTPTGYKLIGSAQLRRDRYLLQHGSIRLWPAHALSAQVFSSASYIDVAPPAVIPNQFDNAWLTQLSELILSELSRTLGITLESQPLTAQELAQIEQKRTQFLIPEDSSPEPPVSAPEDIRLHL